MTNLEREIHSKAKELYDLIYDLIGSNFCTKETEELYDLLFEVSVKHNKKPNLIKR